MIWIIVHIICLLKEKWNELVDACATNLKFQCPQRCKAKWLFINRRNKTTTNCTRFRAKYREYCQHHQERMREVCEAYHLKDELLKFRILNGVMRASNLLYETLTYCADNEMSFEETTGYVLATE